MMLPLIVLDTHGVVTVFSSLEAVTRQLEAPDVVDAEFRLFDMTGREYRLIAESDDACVVIGPPIGDPDFDFVRAAAQRYLSGLSDDARSHAPLTDPEDPAALSRALLPFAI